MPTAANSLINATADHLARHAPFDQMEREHVLWMAQRLELGYYAKSGVILSPEQGTDIKFYVIKQGVVQGEQAVARAQEDAAWLELHEGECFPLGALLSKRPVTSIYRARENVFCYELSAKNFLQLTRLSVAFHDFCTRRIANLLEQSKHIIQAQYAHFSAEQQSMSSPLSAIIRREPVSCSPETPLREALETMQALGIGAMVATNRDNQPVGIFTLHDVLNRVALAQRDLNLPISSVMSTDLKTLPPQALAYEAALEMAKYGFRHVLVTESERLVGVISEKDLFSLQRVGLRQISSDIRNADTLDSLKQSAQDIRQLAHNMMAQGVAAEQLTQFISTLNDLLTTRIIEVEGMAAGAKESPPCADFCWIALGSEGRYEQTLNTDQDNGIIFQVPDGSSADQVRQTLRPVAQRINAALDACGFPLCTGNIMASNPDLCLSVDEWREKFSRWIDHGDPQALLNATIFFDFRPLFGKFELAEKLRLWLARQAESNPRFLQQMAANALRNRPPLGLVRDFSVGEDHALDLKLNGISPFVDAARIFSLATGGLQAGTLHRLRQAAEPLHIPPKEAEAWGEAFLFIQLLRLRLHHQQIEAGLPMSNRVDPDRLNNLDRRILKEAFRQARKLQARLALNYNL
jgi:CBS domain-containing protein